MSSRGMCGAIEALDRHLAELGAQRLNEMSATPLSEWRPWFAEPRQSIPPNAMRVGPDSDAVVWKVCPGDGVEI